MKRVFLGGTCNGSDWRNRMKVYLSQSLLGYFDPVVDDWNEECQARELKEREECDFCLYVITPKKTGDYAIAEAVDDSNKRPDKTVMVLLKEDDDLTFSAAQWKSLMQVAKMVSRNGGKAFCNLKESAKYMESA